MVYAKDNKPNAKNFGKEDKEIKETTRFNTGKTSWATKDFNGICGVYWTRERTTFLKVAYENIPQVWRKGGRFVS